MKIDKKIKILNDLIAKNYDSEKGYLEAANQVEDDRLIALFNEMAKQRYDFGHELKDEIRRLDGDIKTGDTVASKVHRAWMNLRGALAGNEAEAILEEVKIGEKNALNNYQEAIAEFPGRGPAYNTLVRQRALIEDSARKIGRMIPEYTDT